MAIPTSPFGRWRASELSLSDTDPVGTWTDEGSGGNDLTQAGSSRPTFESAGFNGNASVLFDGVDDYMQTAAYSSAVSQPTTIVLMGEVISTTDTEDEYLFDGLGSDRQLLVSDRSTRNAVVVYAGSARDTDLPPGELEGVQAVIAAIFNGGSSDFLLNNVSEFSGSSPGTDPLGGLTLAARIDGTGSESTGHLRLVEVLIYDRALNSTELTDLQDYFESTYQTAATPEVTATIPLTLDVAPTATATHQVQASVPLTLDVAPTATATHQATASIGLTLDVAATAQAQHQVAATVALTVGIAPQAATEYSATAAIPLTLALAPTTDDGEAPTPIVLTPYRESAVPDFQEAAVPAYREPSVPAYQESAS